MDVSDIQAVYAQIERQTIVVYRQTIQSSLNLHGCQKLVTGPDEKALKFIQAKARKDAESIANTFDRELMSQIQRIRAKNFRANRFYFIREIDVWIAARNARKAPSISLNTMTQARQYAQDRFTRENNIGGKWVFAGPPPVCKDCVRIKGYGPQTFEETQKPRKRLPAHVSCPHRWAQLIPKKIPCDEMTFTG